MTPRSPLTIAAALLLIGGPAAAWDAPTECATNGGGWTVTASEPFEAEGCPAESCTGITYNLVSQGGGTPDHVAVLADHEVDIVVPSSNFVGAPCEGDS